MSVGATTKRLNYVIDTLLRSSYSYNAMLLPTLEKLISVDNKVCRAAFKAVLKCREKAISIRLVPKLRAALKIWPLELKTITEAQKLIQDPKMKNRDK